MTGKRVYGPYGRCRGNCGRGTDPAITYDGSGLHMWCAVALEAAEEARLKVRQLRPRKAAA